MVQGKSRFSVLRRLSDWGSPVLCVALWMEFRVMGRQWHCINENETEEIPFYHFTGVREHGFPDIRYFYPMFLLTVPYLAVLYLVFSERKIQNGKPFAVNESLIL